MRIYDVIVENDDQYDEGIGSAIGKGLGAVGKGIGAVASVPQGIGRAVKKGYQSGVATIAGDQDPHAAGSAPAGGGTYQQGYQDGMAAAQGGGGNAFTRGFKQGFAGSAGSTTGGAGTTQQAAPAQAAAPAAAAAKPTPAARPVRPIKDQKFMASIQALKGADIENTRRLLQARAGVAAEGLDEGWRDSLTAAGQKLKAGAGAVGQGLSTAAGATGNALKTGAGAVGRGLSTAGGAAWDGTKWVGGKVAQGATIAGKAGLAGAKWAGGKAVQGAQAAGQAIANAPDTLGTVAGKVGASGTRFRQAYQNARGGSMTSQELQQAIAKMTPKDAAEVLQMFNGMFPAQAAAPAASGQPNLQVQQGGKAPADDMATGTNESIKFRSRYLRMDI